jgi:hypothetical protein
MNPIREQLRAMIDRLPDDKLETVFEQIKEAIENGNKLPPDEWLVKARRVRVEIAAHHGQLPYSLDILHEIREERLNALMGGE